MDRQHLARARRIFRELPRIPLIAPRTPIEGCRFLREAIPGAPQIFIKRDDHQAFLCGGNKLRKLEYIMADVLRRKATTVITVGGIQSNHARITALVARWLGLKCVLVLNGKEPTVPSGNYLIDRRLNVEIHYVGSRAERDPRMREIARHLEKKGERVYPVPLGSSNDIGSFGLVAAIQEILAQQKKLGLKFDAIFVASSSGGTQAGLEVGTRLFGAERTRIIGVSPDDSAESIKASILGAVRPMLKKLGLEDPPDGLPLNVDDGYIGRAYGIPTPESEEATRLFAGEGGTCSRDRAQPPFFMRWLSPFL